MTKQMNWKRIEAIHDHIKRENTGTPFCFSRELGFSKSLLFTILDDMRIMGFPISYCRKKRSYYYSDTCDFITDSTAILRTSEGVRSLL